MTEPGNVRPLSPGWWVRTNRVGITTGGYNWEVSVVGNNFPTGSTGGAYGWAGSATGIAPVTFDALGAGNSASAAASTSWNHTPVVTGSAVVVWVVFLNTAANPSISATYASGAGGGAMTQRGSTLNFGFDGTFTWYAACFTYPAALSGAKTIVITPAATSYIKGNSITYPNVTTFGTLVTNAAVGASMTVSSVPSDVGHRVSNAFFAPSSTAAFTSYDQTSRWSDITVGTWTPIPVLLGDAPGAATVSFSATANVSGAYAGMAIDMS